MTVCCFTGHRTIKADRRAQLVKRLDALLERLVTQGYTEFRTGGARGVDTLAALRVLALREKHPQCKLHLILPCRDQTKFWSAGERAVFAEILEAADRADYVSDVYDPTCMYARNRALVDGSELCIAYLTQNRGGTLYTCSYALKNQLELINLADEDSD